MDYKFFIENFLDIAERYALENVQGGNIIGVRAYSDVLRLEFHPLFKIFSVGEQFNNYRKALIRTLDFVKCILEDPILNEITTLTVDNSSLKDFMSVSFKITNCNLINVEIIIPTEYFNTSSITHLIKTFKIADEKIHKFWDQIKHLEGSVEEKGFFKYKSYANDLEDLVNKARYLIEIKERALKVGLKVEEKIYFVEGSADSHYPVFCASWFPNPHGLEILMEITDGYFDNELVKMLCTKEKITLEDIANLKLDNKKESVHFDLEKPIENQKLSEILSAYLAGLL